MSVFKKVIDLFNRNSQKSNPKSVPFLIIKKEANDSNIIEYNSIEEAISDLEKDSNISAEKIEKLKSSIKKLKDKTSIKIKNGEILK